MSSRAEGRQKQNGRVRSEDSRKRHPHGRECGIRVRRERERKKRVERRKGGDERGLEEGVQLRNDSLSHLLLILRPFGTSGNSTFM